MFRRRLHLALGSLAVAALLQGGVSWWAIREAGQQVVRGRVAADIQNGFLALSAAKARLRVWAAEATLDGSADPQRRVQLLQEMHRILQDLQTLTETAQNMLPDDAESAAEQRARRETLQVLALHLVRLKQVVDDPVEPGSAMDRRATWHRLNQAFDTVEGRDLRAVLAQGVQREREAVERKRAAADRSLRLVQTFATGATLALALAAMLASVAFSRGLRRPLDALKAGATALESGDLRHRVAYQHNDEFGEFARTMNRLAEELERHRARELHARHELEEQVQERTSALQDALQAVQRSDARRRQLLADVSHELRTPATAIRGEAEIALRGATKSADDYREALRQIADAATHLGKVIDDLLTLARVETDNLPLRSTPVDACRPLDEACDQARAAAERRGIRLRRSGAVTSAPVLGDASRLRQVFSILLDNAVQYSQSGTTVDVMLHAVALPDGHQGWEVRIQDQGIGISPQELPHVMSRHFRGEDAARMAAGGLGLGLSLAQGIVRAHGGWLDLDSTPGSGTEARVILPGLQEGRAT